MISHQDAALARRTRLGWADALLALAVAACTVLYTLLALEPPSAEPRGTAVAEAVLSAALIAPALLLRVRPVASAVWVGALLLAWALLFWTSLPTNLGIPPLLVLAPLALHAVTRRARRVRTARIALLAAGAGSLASPAMWVPYTHAYDPSRLLVHWAVIAVAYLLAARSRAAALAHARELEILEERNAALEEGARQRTALAIQSERSRFAGELHDVLAHSLTLIRAQATAGRVSARTDPAAADAALSEVRTTSGDALHELRRVIGMLREGADGGAVQHPGPGPEPAHGPVGPAAAHDPAGDLRILPDRIERFRAAGLDVDARLPTRARLEAESSCLPLEHRLALIRLVDEGLTNALRHGTGTGTGTGTGSSSGSGSGSGSASLHLDLGADGSTLRIENPMPASSGESLGAGIGLTSLDARMRALGGTLRSSAGSGAAAPGPGRVFRFEAHLPPSAGRGADGGRRDDAGRRDDDGRGGEQR